MYESGNALRGIFLTAFVALLLFSSFIFCFHLERPDAMTVEPEILEACFKGAGHALGAAVKIDEAHKDEIPSTKGLLV